MEKRIFKVLAAGLLLGLASCGQHNTAPSLGVNLDSERIYGATREAEPRQLPNEYPATSAEDADRINKIRNKLYPR